MATLNTLRTKGGWIVTIVIAVALLAFLIGDLAGGNSMFGVKEKVGKIDGSPVSYIDYERQVQYLTEVDKIISGETSDQTDAIREYAWQTLINERTVIPGLEKMGIVVSKPEMFDKMYGENPSPWLLQSGLFRNPSTGLFDKAELKSFVDNYRSDASGRSAMFWRYTQERVRDDAMMGKYITLLRGMSYVTKAEGEAAAAHAAADYNGRYVMQAYTTMPDSLFTVSQSELEKYYNDRREQYRRPATRNVEYVTFEVVPSAADYAEARTAMEERAAEFETAENMQQYVSLNSDDPFDPTWYTREQLPADLGEYAFNPDRSPVYGPMMDNDVFRAVRVADRREFPDTIAFRQMGFAPGSEVLADSVYGELQKGENFLLLADQYSALPAGQAESGRMSTQYIPMELGEILYPAGERFRKISNANGTFIFEVYYRGASSPKVQLATLTYRVEPSSATQQAAYAKANAFLVATAGAAANFSKVAADSSYFKQPAYIQSGQTQLSGFENARELIRWSFNAKKGAVSTIMELDGNFVIAQLTEAHEEGYTPLADEQFMIRAELLREKKFRAIAEKMTGASSLDALAANLSTSVGELTAVNYSAMPYLPGVGMEPALIGVLAGGVPEGQLSKPIKGMNGVYVVEATSHTEATAISAAEWQVRLKAQAEETLGQSAYQALILKSNVVDGRSKYF